MERRGIERRPRAGRECEIEERRERETLEIERRVIEKNPRVGETGGAWGGSRYRKVSVWGLITFTSLLA
eukprot:1340972-Amorphochlora_amoeboformis.AAC.1